MEVFFDPLKSADKIPTGAAARREGLFLQFQVTDECFYRSAWVILTKDGEFPVWHRMKFEEYSGKLVRFSIFLKDLDCGLYFYRFAVTAEETVFFGMGEDGRAKLWSEEPFELSVYEDGYSGCEWFRGTVMYHIFVDRFFRTAIPKTRDLHMNPVRNRRIHTDVSDIPDHLPNSAGRILNNDFYGGTLDGIVEKLGYLESLGVGVLYLSPVFEAASCHKYDTGDYEKIDGDFGGLEAFRRLVSAAHARGMKIVLDGVFNHTGDDSVYFNKYGEYDSLGAFQSRDSRYFGWYGFTHFPDSYRCWWGIDILPTLRKGTDFEQFIAGEGGVLDRWLSEGADGFRLDVVDELSQNFTERIRERIKSHPGGRLVVGEVWEDASNKIAYGVRRKYFLGQELDSVMNYPLRTAILESIRQKNFHILETCVRAQLDHYPKCALDNLMNILATHDTARTLTALMRETKPLTRAEKAGIVLSGGELEEGMRRMKSAVFLQFFLYGNPCVYYGDEIAMQGAEDPFNRGYFEWERAEKGGGMLEIYRSYSKIRRELPELTGGLFRIECVSSGVFVFSRSEGGNSSLFGVNESSEPFEFGGLEIPAKGVAFVRKLS